MSKKIKGNTKSFYANELDEMQENRDERTMRIGATPPFYVNFDGKGMFKMLSKVQMIRIKAVKMHDQGFNEDFIRSFDKDWTETCKAFKRRERKTIWKKHCTKAMKNSEIMLIDIRRTTTKAEK